MKGHNLVLGWGCFLAAAAYAQGPGKLIVPLVRSVSVSVRSTTNSGCAGVVPEASIQQDARGFLQVIGFQLAEPPDAIISVHADCGAIRGREGSRFLPVQQCVRLSEGRPGVSKGADANFETTWQKCQSYECAGPQCQEMATSGLHDLLIQLAGTYQANEFAESGMRTASPPPGSGQGGDPTAAAYRDTVRDVFYSFYLASCICLFVYWVARSRFRHS